MKVNKLVVNGTNTRFTSERISLVKTCSKFIMDTGVLIFRNLSGSELDFLRSKRRNCNLKIISIL